MRLTNSPRYFGTVAVTLHWVIGLAILAMIAIGYIMTSQENYKLYQLHKSLGITILALSVLRLVWRFVDPPPPLPPHMPAWEKFTAHAMHWLFYALMIGIPLGGWAVVSLSPNSDFVPTKIWGAFNLPLLPVLPTLPDREDLADKVGGLHGLMAYAFLALIVLHIGAALKHQFWDRDRVLHAMLPVVPDPEVRG